MAALATLASGAAKQSMNKPAILDIAFASIETLKGVGAKSAERLAKAAGGARLVDLWFDPPIRAIDRSFDPPLDAAPDGAVISPTIRIIEHAPSPRPRAPYRIMTENDTGALTVLYFHMRAPQAERLLPVGAERRLSGKVERRGSELIMVHPERIWKPQDAPEDDVLEPVYALVDGLSAYQRRKAGELALARLPDPAEWLDEAIVNAQGWPSWHEAVTALHAPKIAKDLEPASPARRRLAYDELLANQLALKLLRQARRRAGRPAMGDGRFVTKIREALPFALTGAQQRAWAEIERDLAQSQRMTRLLMGDVGAGKTVVAALTVARMAEAGRQSAMMAPTEVLARQHARVMAQFLQPAGLRVAALTGRDTGADRRAIEAALQEGRWDLVVGTHALFSETTAFRDLGLAVVDEQHRFGVAQRLALTDKGAAVDLLAMTATPIPRTLALAAYGDLDVSRLAEKPPGRTPVDTRALPDARLDEIIEGVGRAITKGGRAYWVCPFVEETADGDDRAAQARAGILQAALGDRARIGLIHGRLAAAEKEAVVGHFQDGDIDLLVATSVIEVGVDAPDATVMVIEGAERFGLAQLHQLRGRVGRSDKQSVCILCYAPPLSKTAKARLKVLRQTDDGFLIAEEDLKLRGGGDPLGLKQTGFAKFRLADPIAHADLLAMADDDAERIVRLDPQLDGPRGDLLRTLLTLFERRAAARYLRSG